MDCSAKKDQFEWQSVSLPTWSTLFGDFFSTLWGTEQSNFPGMWWKNPWVQADVSWVISHVCLFGVTRGDYICSRLSKRNRDFQTVLQLGDMSSWHTPGIENPMDGGLEEESSHKKLISGWIYTLYAYIWNAHTINIHIFHRLRDRFLYSRISFMFGEDLCFLCE